MARTQLPRSVWALGVTSMLMDLASEMVHGLLPVFLVSVLHASVATLGAIEGVAESIASITKVFSGALSDRLGKRKPVGLFGYGLAALAKFAFPLATSAGWVAAAHSLDRFGKGVRGAPRDALVADLALPENRGAAFGLRQSLDSLGSLAGPALALALMWLFNNNVRAVLWIAPIPALLATVVMWLWVQEPPHQTEPVPKPFAMASLRHLGRGYWMIVLLGAMLTLARFSEAFLVLRAQDRGIPAGLVPVVLVIMNVVYMLGAYPAGRSADRRNVRGLLIWGLMALLAAHGVLSRANSPSMVLLGAALWGLHMALTQGILAKLVADAAPTAQRGTGFGIFNLVCGVATFFASWIAGVVWDRSGPGVTFAAGAAVTAITAIGLMAYVYAGNRTSRSTS